VAGFCSAVDSHVRTAFATNDERTAKRISEALGAKTELRSQKNYTGHRLAPWLSHMMVSRQETQRALMTPGEVMQMAPTDEVVMCPAHRPFWRRSCAISRIGTLRSGCCLRRRWQRLRHRS
jgi:type IV secretory pathway TraG/TraD family ATPase VirD4